MKRDIPAILMLGLTALLIAGGFIAGSFSDRLAKSGIPDTLHCVISLNGQEDTTSALLYGYNYYILELFARHIHADADIRLVQDGDSAADSVKVGNVDILVIPYHNTIRQDSLLSSTPVDSTSVWLMPLHRKGMQKMADKWIDSFHKSDEYEMARQLFFTKYNPVKQASRGEKHTYLSPYDEILHEYADSIGWDWRILAAIAFQESKFRIDAKSPRGAVGLMQMMPRSAESLSEHDLVNPRKNIEVAAKMLAILSDRYKRIAPNQSERQKIVLAAYNAGAGRINDVMNYASYRGVSRSCWDSLVTIIPEMRDSAAMEALDTVKLGAFRGRETIAYVNKVMSLYEAFKKIDKTHEQ